MMFLGTWVRLLPAALVIFGHYAAYAEPIVLLDPTDPARQAACARVAVPNEHPRDYRECLYREADTAWSIEIWEGGGIPGTPDANIVVPDALQVLQEIVDRCELGSTFYLRLTDGVATLHIANPALSPSQIGCIRSAERPGIFLRNEKPQA